MTAGNEHASGQDVAKTTPMLRPEDYAGIASFEDALRLVGDKLGGEIVDASDLGDGFTVLDKAQKKSLIGVTFIVLSVSFHEGDYKREDGETGEFASLRLVTKNGQKYVLNDGGTGIPEQIKMLWQRKPESQGKPIVVHNGLRVSEYDHPQYGRSETYYLDTSPAK